MGSGGTLCYVQLKSMSEVTQILEAVGRGEQQGAEALFPLVYDELRRLAAVRMAQEAAGHTLQPTALVHEVWLQLVGRATGRGTIAGIFLARRRMRCAAS